VHLLFFCDADVFLGSPSRFADDRDHFESLGFEDLGEGKSFSLKTATEGVPSFL
jgi:hypothetical protein